MYDNFAGAVPGGGRGTGGGIETGTKLYISNLDYGVSNDDIKELFSEVGDLKRCSINYDRSGRSKGTAEVVFTRKPDAVAAVKRYNNVQLDGKPMKIEMIGTNLNSAAVPVVRSNGAMTIVAGRGRTVSSQAMPFARGPGSDRGRGAGGAFRGRGGSRGGRGAGGRGGGRGGAPAVEKTVEDLDADLETYHAEAMQTN
jgi:THO complex subunit 4